MAFKITLLALTCALGFSTLAVSQERDVCLETPTQGPPVTAIQKLKGSVKQALSKYFAGSSLKKIDSKDRINASNCKKNKVNFEKVKKVLQDWEKSGTEDHQYVIGDLLQIQPSPLEKSGFPKGVFSVCDPSGTVYAVGQYSSNLEADYLFLTSLVASPDPSQKGGGKAAMKFLMKSVLMEAAQGIKLTPLEGAVGFYKSLGMEKDKSTENNFVEIYKIELDGIYRHLTSSPTKPLKRL